MYASVPWLAHLDAIAPAAPSGIEALAARDGTVGTEPFASGVRDFYLTNPIARASAVMAEMSALKKSFDQGATGTHG
jgi:NADH-quinone oxidoreductase subunit G